AADAATDILRIARSVARPSVAPYLIARRAVQGLAGTGSPGSPGSPLARAIALRRTRRPSSGRHTLSRYTVWVTTRSTSWMMGTNLSRITTFSASWTVAAVLAFC